MKLLLDTHLLLWLAGVPERLSPEALSWIDHPENDLLFSSASIWEVCIKASLGRGDFHVDAGLLRQGLLENGYLEIPITGRHTLTTRLLPPIHRDPFDRILIAQALDDGVLLLTGDETLARYPGPIRTVR